ncbi:hypothetical protein BJ742DRAFT_853754 [Cladochytrium replicatum]|nr:hypothetical protein BJ742DRAFT_853754 [Cladochytrium replicatum]
MNYVQTLWARIWGSGRGSQPLQARSAAAATSSELKRASSKGFGPQFILNSHPLPQKDAENIDPSGQFWGAIWEALNGISAFPDSLSASIVNTSKVHEKNEHSLRTQVLVAEVTLHRSSVRLIRDQRNKEGETSSEEHKQTTEGKYGLEFDFDASVPCMVRIFWCARERFGSSEPRFLSASASTFGPFQVGQNQHFFVPPNSLFDPSDFNPQGLFTPNSAPQKPPQTARSPGAADSAVTAHAPGSPDSIDLEVGHAEHKHPDVIIPASTPKNTVYPLVIVLECIEEGKNTQGQCQVTYFTLVQSANDYIEVKLIKQKMIIKDCSFAILDVYGFAEQRREDPDSEDVTNEAETSRECTVCLSEMKDTMVLPCRHLCLCKTCGERLRLQGRNAQGELISPNNSRGRNNLPKCPICRQVFHSIVQVTLARQSVAVA